MVNMTQAGCIALTIAYRGAAFAGYARQPGQLTVQGELEHALETVYRRAVPTCCAGRTDAGVHARGQVASFDLDAAELAAHPLAHLSRSLNALTHDDIVIRAARLEAPGFSARFDAQVREYRYFFADMPTLPLFARDFCWHVPARLNLGSMQRAGRALLGEHDFASFCKATSAKDKPTCRFVRELDFFRTQAFGEELACMRIVGNAFLHNMVRTLAGTMVAVGLGRRDEAWVGRVLRASDRTAAGECAPACGLVFWSVEYGSRTSLAPSARKSDMNAS